MTHNVDDAHIAKWTEEQYRLKQQLIVDDKFAFSIPSVAAMRLRDPERLLLQLIDSAIDFISSFSAVDDSESKDDKKTPLRYIGGVDISHAPSDENL